MRWSGRLEPRADIYGCMARRDPRANRSGYDARTHGLRPRPTGYVCAASGVETILSRRVLGRASGTRFVGVWCLDYVLGIWDLTPGPFLGESSRCRYIDTIHQCVPLDD
jgi:hypothetical protein